MAVLNWGGALVEVSKHGSDGKPSNTWIKFPEAVKETVRLNTDAGSELLAEDDDGGIVDSRRGKSRYNFEITIFVKKGDEKPIEDEDGVIVENYAVRWSPKDKSLKGRQMQKTSVSVVETWASNEGSRLKYTFMGLVPNEGKILTEYQAPTTP
jgi:hypothetical protein